MRSFSVLVMVYHMVHVYYTVAGAVSDLSLVYNGYRKIFPYCFSDGAIAARGNSREL